MARPKSMEPPVVGRVTAFEQGSLSNEVGSASVAVQSRTPRLPHRRFRVLSETHGKQREVRVSSRRAQGSEQAEATLTRLARQACQALGVDRAGVIVCDDDQPGSMVLVAAHGVTTSN